MDGSSDSTPVFPQLRPTARIRRYSDVCCVIDQLDGNLRQIHPSSAAILALCTGSYTVCEITNIINHGLNLAPHTAADLVNKTLDLCEPHLLQGGKRLDRPEQYHITDFLYDPIPRNNGDGPVPLEKPLEIILRLTNKCNFACDYCFHGQGVTHPEPHNILSVDEFIDITEQAVSLDVVRFTVTGGEPLLSDAFLPVISNLVAHDIFPYVSTNGYFINSRLAKELLDTGLNFIQVSLDTADETIFDNTVGLSGAFSQVTTNIANLTNMGYTIRVKAVMLPPNYHTAYELGQLCADLGVSILVLDQFMPSQCVQNNRSFILNSDQRSHIAHAVSKLTNDRLNCPLNIVNNTSRDLRWSCENDCTACGGMLTAMTVHCNGDIGVCELLPDTPSLTFGNTRTDRLEDVWCSDGVLSWLRSVVKPLNEPCLSCEYLDKCRTGCFAQSLVYSETYLDADPRCWKLNLPDNPFDPLGE